MAHDRESKGWISVFLVVVALGLGIPVYEHVRDWLGDDMANWLSFVLAGIAGICVALPVVLLLQWIITREQSGKTDGIFPMFYRPAIFPLWIFTAAALKNLNDFNEVTPWAFLLIIILVLGLCVGLQKMRGQLWPWWVAISVGVVTTFAAIPSAMGIAQLMTLQ